VSDKRQMHAVHRHFSLEDVLADSRPIDDMSLFYANVISELALVRDGVLSFMDSPIFLLPMRVVLSSFCVLLDWFFFFFIVL